jgi:hypothetical protein
LNACSLFHRAGFPIHARDAAELLHFDALPEDSVIIVISRTGRSVEIVNLTPLIGQSWNCTFLPVSNR